MSPIRLPICLLSVSVFAFCLPSIAQNSQNQTAQTSAAQTPIVQSQTAPPSLPLQLNGIVTVVPSNPLRIVPEPGSAPFTARLHPPCFTLRSYGFTNRDLQSSNPRASTYSTCTYARPNSVLQGNIPTKLVPVK